MKKLILFLILSILLFTGCNSEEPFYLEDKYYGSSDVIDLDSIYLEKLIKDKKSFAVFIYQPLCSNSENFESVLTKFLKNKQISIYKMAFSDMKKTSLYEKVKYYPSFVIFRNGEIVDYLDPNSDSDTSCFQSSKAFNYWFLSYVLLKEEKRNTNLK